MRVVAVTSGKGGVGKTNISANLAIALASLGERVVVLDGDIGLANLDVILGCRSEWTLQDVISGDKSLLEIVQEGPGNIRFIAGGSGIESLFSLDTNQVERFSNDLVTLSGTTDILLLDTGAGLDSNVVAFLNAASEILVVVTPDPASITDGYAAVKAVLATNREAKVSLIVNQVLDENEATGVYDHLNSVAKRFLNFEIALAGYVRFDRRALMHIRNRVPFILGDKGSPASKDILRIASDLTGKVQTRATVPDIRSKLRAIFQMTHRTA